MVAITAITTRGEFINLLSEYTTIRTFQHVYREDNNMKKKTIRGLITGTLFMGMLALNPSAQAEELPTIDQACIFFNKVVFHVNPDLTTPSGFVLSKKDTRVIILPGPKLNVRQNETEALLKALCGSNTNCIHTKENTFIDSVEFSADCNDADIRGLTESTTSPASVSESD